MKARRRQQAVLSGQLIIVRKSIWNDSFTEKLVGSEVEILKNIGHDMFSVKYQTHIFTLHEDELFGQTRKHKK